jgi:hypothetical protein
MAAQGSPGVREPKEGRDMPERTFVTAGRLDGVLRAGTPVDVRSRFVGSWSRGFEVAEQVAERGYRLRRLSDGTVLPDVFSDDEVRPRHQRRDGW